MALVAVCRDELARQKRALDTFEVAAGLPWLLVARDPERRWREAREHFLYQMNLYAAWFAEAGMQVASTARSDADLHAQGVLVVTPEQAVESVRRYVQENAVTRFYGWTVPPGLPPAWSDEHVELMAREVIPAARG